MSTEKQYVPKVGDWVIIQKSTGNWNSNMDKHVGKIVQVTKVSEYEGKYHEIKFLNDGGWYWGNLDDHYRPATLKEIIDHVFKIEVPRYLRWVQYIGMGLGGHMCTTEKFQKDKIFNTSIDTVPPSAFEGQNWEDFYKTYSYNVLPATEKEYKEWNEKNKKKEKTGGYWRFKTEEEFKRGGLWDYDHGCPENWNFAHDMNHYMGADIPSHHHSKCNDHREISISGWTFRPGDYTNEPLPNPGYLPKKKAHQEILPQTKSEISIEKPKSSVKEIVVPKSYIPTPDLKRIVIKPVNIKL